MEANAGQDLPYLFGKNVHTAGGFPYLFKDIVQSVRDLAVTLLPHARKA